MPIIRKNYDSDSNTNKPSNYVPDGAFRVLTENGTASKTIGTPKHYLSKFFYSRNTTGTGTIDADITSLNEYAAGRLTATAAVTDLTGTNVVDGMVVNISERRIAHLNSKSVVVSVKVATNFPTASKLPVALQNGTKSLVHAFNIPAGAVETTLELPVTFESTTVGTGGVDLYIGGCNEGTKQTSTVDTWLTGDYISTSDSYQWVKTAGQYLTVTEVGLYEGAEAPSFQVQTWEPEIYLTAEANPKDLRNYVDNPSFQVSQQNGDGPNTPAVSTDFYGADRFISFLTSGTGGALSVELPIGARNRKEYKVTATTAATTLTTTQNIQPLTQRFEARKVYELNGKQVTLGIQLKTNFTGNAAIAIANHDSSRSYVVDAPVISGENLIPVTLTLESNTVDAIDEGLGLTIRVASCNEGTYQTATTGVWQAGEYFCSTSSTQWAKTLNNYVQIGDVQLVEGDTLPAFKANDYDDDEDVCKRYLQFYSAIAATGYYSANYIDSYTIPSMRTTFSITVGSNTDQINIASASLFADGDSAVRVAITGSAVGQVRNVFNNVSLDANL